MPKPNFELMREFFIKGTFDAYGHPVDVTFEDVAGKFGVDKSTVWRKAKKESWQQQRVEYKNQLFAEEKEFEEKVREELRKAGLPEYTNFIGQVGKMCYGMMGKFIVRLTAKDSTYTPRFSEVMMAVDKLEHIINFMEGREKGSMIEVDFTWKDMIMSLSEGINDPDK